MCCARPSPWDARSGPTNRFLADDPANAEPNRRILYHRQHDAFPADHRKAVYPIIDLMLDLDRDPEQVLKVMAVYAFRDPATGHHSLAGLARQDSPFISNARCRHFLAAIAPGLRYSVGRTPHPDMTLTNRETLSAPLGAKAALWHLFNVNPPILRLYAGAGRTR